MKGPSAAIKGFFCREREQRACFGCGAGWSFRHDTSGMEMSVEASVLFLTHKKVNLGTRRCFFGGRWDNRGLSSFLWEEFLSCAVFEWHQGAVNRSVAQAVLRGVNEPFDGVQSVTGISTNHGGAAGGVRSDWEADCWCLWWCSGFWGSERTQLTFKQGCKDHPWPSDPEG